MPLGFALSRVLLGLVLLGHSGLVYCAVISDVVFAEGPTKSKSARSAKSAQATPKNDVSSTLPHPVAEMREAILSAVQSGSIEEMRVALEWNELKPTVADEPVSDAIAYWRQSSADGEGREILEVLGQILAQPFAVLPVGQDLENNRLYVWPRFAEVADAALTAAERDAKLRLVPAAVQAEMARTGRYLWWRLAIGADGTWHSFVKAK